eukprot:1907589-Rhodomonas_salina.2
MGLFGSGKWHGIWKGEQKGGRENASVTNRSTHLTDIGSSHSTDSDDMLAVSVAKGHQKSTDAELPEQEVVCHPHRGKFFISSGGSGGGNRTRGNR